MKCGCSASSLGSWDLDVTWHEGELIGRTEKGEWHFCYALDGRAVLDVWTVPPRNARAKGADGYEWGATLRFYDPTLRAWRSTWIGPAHGAVLTFLARAVGNEIVLEGKTEDGWPMRWIFSQITPRSFHVAADALARQRKKLDIAPVDGCAARACQVISQRTRRIPAG